MAGTKDYNALSVLVQSVADVEVVRKVLPTNFYPRPKVDSAIVKITPNAAKRAKVGDVPRFRAFLRDLYVHRRKNLRQALVGWPQGRKDKADVDAKLAALGIDGTLRSEALDIEATPPPLRSLRAMKKPRTGVPGLGRDLSEILAADDLVIDCLAIAEVICLW